MHNVRGLKFMYPLNLVSHEIGRKILRYIVSLHTYFASSTLIVALIHALLHLVLLTSFFTIFSISSLYPLTLSFFHLSFLFYMYVSLVSLSSLILSIYPNHLSLLTLIYNALFDSIHFLEPFISHFIHKLYICDSSQRSYLISLSYISVSFKIILCKMGLKKYFLLPSFPGSKIKVDKSNTIS
jgi:hypothetical protein